jgi:hypothetical protein
LPVLHNSAIKRAGLLPVPRDPAMKRFGVLALCLMCLGVTLPAAAQVGVACSPNGAAGVNNLTSNIETGLFCSSGSWVASATQLGSTAASCGSTAAGTIQWTGSALQYCNDSSWATVEASNSTSGIYLGTSASATNPQRSGEVTTGFYSLNSGEAGAAVNVSGTGTQIMKLTSAGENIVSGTLTVNNNAILSAPSAAVLHLGAADAASPVAQAFGVQNVAAGTSNTAGVNFTVRKAPVRVLAVLFCSRQHRPQAPAAARRMLYPQRWPSPEQGISG